jgi:hypothetical protein
VLAQGFGGNDTGRADAENEVVGHFNSKKNGLLELASTPHNPSLNLVRCTGVRAHFVRFALYGDPTPINLRCFR